MRRSLVMVILTAFIVAGCTDTSPTGPRSGLRPDGQPLLTQESVSGYVDRLTVQLFPKGLETATGSRWSTVKSKLAAGDLAGATKHLRDLAKFIKLKTGEVENFSPEFQSQSHAAAALVHAMALFVYRPDVVTPPATGGDVAFEVVPAGAAATIVTPAKRAAVDIPAGSTNEDRLITIVQDARLFPGHCNGPLVTKLCQYPLFYDLASFPNVAFTNRVTVAVCMVTLGDRGPLDPPSDGEGEGPVHNRLRLARPFSPTQPLAGRPHPETNPTIEILPLRAVQRGLTECDDIPTPTSVASAKTRRGWLGYAQRQALAVAAFAGRILTPKDLYAFDSGPEHEVFGLGSPFNAVDPESRPDLAAAAVVGTPRIVAGQPLQVTYTVRNTSPRIQGNATASSEAVAARFMLRPRGTCVGGTVLASVTIPALAPNGVEQQTISIPISIETVGGEYELGFDVDANDAGGGVELASITLPRLPEYTLANNSVCVPVTIDAVVAATAVSSSVSLVASANANGVVVRDEDTKTQGATSEPLSAEVAALSETEGGSVLAEGRLSATWKDAANGQVLFSRVGWITAATGGNNSAQVNQGTDWTYTFTATRTGTFALQYTVTLDDADPTGFGLNAVEILWASGETPLTRIGFAAVPATTESPTTGTVTQPVVAGTTYTVRLKNNANISGILATRTAHFSATFNWSVAVPPPIL